MCEHKYWYVTPKAARKLEQEIANDGRRSWNPVEDSPSLASLQGRASRFKHRYETSRAALFRKAKLRVVYIDGGVPGCTCRRTIGLVKSWGEEWSSTDAPRLVVLKALQKLLRT